jgi:hypothetical protein
MRVTRGASWAEIRRDYAKSGIRAVILFKGAAAKATLSQATELVAVGLNRETTLAGSAWARTALRSAVTALALLLFLLALRRSGERAGRLAERLETRERTHDVQGGCSSRSGVSSGMPSSATIQPSNPRAS